MVSPPIPESAVDDRAHVRDEADLDEDGGSSWWRSMMRNALLLSGMCGFTIVVLVVGVFPSLLYEEGYIGLEAYEQMAALASTLPMFGVFVASYIAVRAIERLNEDMPVLTRWTRRVFGLLIAAFLVENILRTGFETEQARVVYRYLTGSFAVLALLAGFGDDVEQFASRLIRWLRPHQPTETEAGD
ncbi:hypothetical protein [Halomarina oriensis]|uniref:Uncharacterized protein n=1 Tax=Halomarina oriensis TaxID=671145 RepID=A0A6B0GLY7_9EURY|nr:hypothetical protein [Halomarina oriensis]MWG35896.1 hypothetical protein [Halomarina oriensis]